MSRLSQRWLARLSLSLLVLLAANSSARPLEFHADVAQAIRYQQPLLLIDNVRLVDGTGQPAREQQSVLLRDGRIASIGPAGGPVPAGAESIDGEGGTLLPGFVMLHEHLIYLDPTASLPAYTTEHLPMPPLYLAGGTTTVRTTGTMSARDDLRVKALIEQGRVAGPRLFVTGPFLEGPGSFSYQMRPIGEPEDARLFVRYWVNAGATSFKAYMNVSRAVLGAAIDEAHALGAVVTGHLCSVTFAEAAALGIDNLEHGLYVASDLAPDKPVDECVDIPRTERAQLMDVTNPQVQELIGQLVAADVAITSTLPVFAAGLHPAIPTAESLALLSPRSRARAEKHWQSMLDNENPERLAQMRDLLDREMAFEKAFVDAGGTLLVGTDPTGWGGTLPPNATHAALQLLVEAGFSPLQVLSMATLGGARFLGIEEETGSIAVGKQADLVLVRGRPDETITDSSQVELVFRDGVGYDPQALIDSVKGTVGR